MLPRAILLKRNASRNLSDASSNHLIDHDFTLTDVDGYPTRWAVYSPRLLNGDLQWSDQVGFNALGILAHLKVAIHICGDQKFKDAYQMLIDKWGYNVKAMFCQGNDSQYAQCRTQSF